MKPPTPRGPANQEDDSASVTKWFRGVEAGDDESARMLWEYCIPRLIAYSRKRLPTRFRKALDEEDVALSSFRSVCERARDGDLGEIHDRFELLRLMTCVTQRKTINHLKSETRQKRGGGNVRSESEAELPEDSASRRTNLLDRFPSAAPDPAYLLEYEEAFRKLIDALEDPALETIALLRLEGYSVVEIAGKVGSAKRSVERRLNLIRRIWNSDEAE